MENMKIRNRTITGGSTADSEKGVKDSDKMLSKVGGDFLEGGSFHSKRPCCEYVNLIAS